MTEALLDIESTSLFADMGMLVCGTLRIDGSDKVYFVDSPRREVSVLRRLLKDLGRLDTIISFNGKSFDIPFLVSRGLILGLDNPDLHLLHHVDIYEQCRRVLRFDKLGLDHISRILGVEGKAGCTGREVPHLYFRYLSDREAETKNQIIAHCIWDIDLLEEVYRKIKPLMQMEVSRQ